MVAGFKRYRGCPRSCQPAMTAAIVRDHAISLSKEEHHLAVPVGTSRPDSCTSSTCAACDGVCRLYFRSPLSLSPYRRNTLSKRPICSVTILIASSLFSGLAIGAPASIAASCRIAASRYRRVSANKSIGSMPVLRCFASNIAPIWTRLLGANLNSIFASRPSLNSAKKFSSWHSGGVHRIIPECRLLRPKPSLSPSA